jgi:hypothetical protein
VWPVGDLNSGGLFDDNDDKNKKVSKRARKSTEGEESDYESDGSSKPLEKKPSIRDNPKISTVTNRQRMSKKSSSAKKSTKRKTVKKK